MTPDIAVPIEAGQLLPFRESVLAMLGVSFVAMLVALDQTIVGTALPRIVADLKGFDLYAWVATSYMLTSVITIPIFGRLGDLFGRKPFLMAAIILFTIASIMCGMAANMLFLVIARGLARDRRRHPGGHDVRHCRRSLSRPQASPALAGVCQFGVCIGEYRWPDARRVLTQYGGWRLVFFVNLPVGIVSLLFVRAFPAASSAGRVQPPR